MTSRSKLAGEVNGESPSGAQRDSILGNEPNSQGSDSLEINIVVGVARIPLEAHHVWNPTTSSSAPRGLGLRPRPPGGALSLLPCPTDAPYARGRLVITPLGAGRFTCEVTRGADKWAIRA
jgi:hypothetical protein